MTNLDKVYTTWANIEETYQQHSKGKSRKDFLMQMIGSEDSLVKLRHVISKDFISSDENNAKLNDLFSVLENAQKRLQCTQNIENLQNFIWGNDEDDEPLIFKAEDYEPTLAIEPTDDQFFLRNGLFGPIYKQTNFGNGVQVDIPSKESESLIVIRDSTDLIIWLNKNKQNFNELSDFYKKSFSYLLASASKSDIMLPIALTDAHLSLASISQFRLPINISKFNYKCVITGIKGFFENEFGSMEVVIFD